MGSGLPLHTVQALFDELAKIAKIASGPSEAANRSYGLPLKPDKSKKPRYDHGSESDAAYRSHSMLFGDQTPNYTMSDITTSPHTSPGGV